MIDILFNLKICILASYCNYIDTVFKLDFTMEL